jgi:hypothetical protein
MGISVGVGSSVGVGVASGSFAPQPAALTAAKARTIEMKSFFVFVFTGVIITDSH